MQLAPKNEKNCGASVRKSTKKRKRPRKRRRFKRTWSWSKRGESGGLRQGFSEFAQKHPQPTPKRQKKKKKKKKHTKATLQNTTAHQRRRSGLDAGRKRKSRGKSLETSRRGGGRGLPQSAQLSMFCAGENRRKDCSGASTKKEYGSVS